MEKIYIKNQDGTNFYDIYLTEISVSNNVMGDLYATSKFMYKDNSLADKFINGIYIDYGDDRFYISEQPSLSHNNKDNSGMTQYDIKFSHAREDLKNVPFTDEPLPNTNEFNFRNGSRKVQFFGKLTEMINRINACLLRNAPSGDSKKQWELIFQEGFIDNTEPQQIIIDNGFITDALQTMYDTWKVPYMFVGFKIYIGVPVTEIGHVFEYGQGVGLKNDDRISKKNKIITRISGCGSTDNIPYGYPIIKNAQGEIVRHIYTRPHLMPTVWVEGVKRKVLDGSDEPLIDWYDAVGEEYPNQINPEMPSFGIHDFEDIKPSIDGATHNGQAIDIIKSVSVDNNYDDEFDPETLEYKFPTFDMELYPLGFDLYAQAAVTGEMTLSMKSGDCRGANFPFAVDEEAFNLSFYVDGKFTPNNPNRNFTKFPDSTNESIKVKFFKEDATFGRLYPNPYQIPKAGDKFVILYIEMPQKYVDEAQIRLDNALKQYMKENNVHQYEYPLQFDEYFLKNNESIFRQIGTNTLVVFKYNGQELKLPIQSITINDGTSALPTYDIKLTDEIAVTFNSVGKVADDLRVLDKEITQSSIKGKRQAVNFYNGIKKVEEGLFDADGNNRIGVLEALVIKANMSLIGQISSNFSLQNCRVSFNGLNEAIFISGTLFHYEISRATEYDYTQAEWNIAPFSKNNIEIDKDYYIYIQANRTNNSAIWVISENEYKYDQDPNVFYFLWGQAIIVNGERHPFNTYGLTATLGGFIVTQELRSPNFALNDTQFTGMLIDLIRAKMYMGDGAEIIAKTLKIRQQNGVDYNVDTAINEIGQATNNANLLLNDISNDNKLTPDEKQSIKKEWDVIVAEKPKNDSQADYYGVNKTGYETAYTNLSNYITPLIQDLNTTSEITGTTFRAIFTAYYSARTDLLNAISTKAKQLINAEEQSRITDIANVNANIGSLQNQIDGVVENWFYNYVPTINNYPANTWTTINEKRNHIGDTFTNIEPYIDDESTPNSGKSWRWIENPIDTFLWTPISDSDAVKALQEASKALSTADGKSSTYILKPSAYRIGDMWVLESDSVHIPNKKGELLFANVNSDIYSDTHWTAKLTYTDDTTINSFINNIYTPFSVDIQSQVDNKAETWYQDTDPSIAWNTDELKTQHKGDIWYNTSNSTINGVEPKGTAVWSGEVWQITPIPTSLFDTIDGKGQIFTLKPTTYNINDLWIVENDYVIEGYKKGELLISSSSRENSFNAADWDSKLRYTDDTTANIAISDVQKLKFLRNAFSDVSTEISGGVVLSGFVGVYDGEKITGGITGGNVGDVRVPLFFANAENYDSAFDTATAYISEDGVIKTRDIDRKKSVTLSSGFLQFWNIQNGQEIEAFSASPEKLTSSVGVNSFADTDLLGGTAGNINIAINANSYSIRNQVEMNAGRAEIYTNIEVVKNIIAGDNTTLLIPNITFNVGFFEIQYIPSEEEGWQSIIPDIFTGIESYIIEKNTNVRYNIFSNTPTSSKSIIVTGKSLPSLPAGEYIYKVSIYFDIYYARLINTIIYGNLYGSISNLKPNNMTGSWSSDISKSKIFGNGLLYSDSTNKYIGFISNPTGHVFEQRTINNGVRFNNDGQWIWSELMNDWIPIDKILIEGVSSNTGMITYNTYNKKTLTWSRLSTGLYRITFPAGMSIPVSKYMVLITTDSTSTTRRFATLLDKQPTYFEVELSGYSAVADGSFQFQVRLAEKWYR